MSEERCTKGWTWGVYKIENSHLVLQMDSKIGFKVRFGDLLNASLPTKNELALELQDSPNEPTQLVEVRLHIPNPDAAEDLNEKIMQEANLTYTSGESISVVPELSMVTPRGKYNLEFYESFIKMHGKTYDYKLLNKNITRAFLLPKLDNVHVAFIIGLENPIRQGNTTYPFIVIEFNKDLEEVISLNISRDRSKEIFGEEAEVLDGALYDSVSRLFKALVKVNIIIPGTFRTKKDDQAIKCSYRANAGFLYPLQKSFIFITKPVIYIRFEEIKFIEFARADKSINVRSFDLHVTTRETVYQFTSIDRDEYQVLYSFLDKKRITIRNLEEAEKFDPGEGEDDDEGDEDDFAVEDESEDEVSHSEDSN